MSFVPDNLDLSLAPGTLPGAVMLPAWPDAPVRGDGLDLNVRRQAIAPVRVLHVINGEHYAGAERVQDLLAARLPDFGYEVAFATLKPGRFAAKRHTKTAPLAELSMRGRFDLRPVRALVRLVREQKYQLIHTHTPRTAMLGRLAARMAGVPLVHHLHSPTATDTTHWLRDQVNAAVERWSCRQADAVIAVSDSLADYGVRQGIRQEQLRVVPNGIPVASSAAERSLPDGTCMLGCVALFRPRKGIEVLLESLALLRREGRDVRLRAVGIFETPAYEQTIREHVERLQLGPYVSWAGFSSNVLAELAQIDVFVLPSLFGEGMPMVVLEAMSVGLPVVATRVEGVPQAIRDGVDGLLAAPGDPEDLAVQLRRILDGDVDSRGLVRSARQRQTNLFSDRSMARAIADVYNRVLHPASELAQR